MGLGCIMFELMTLKPLFKAKNSTDLIYKISEILVFQNIKIILIQKNLIITIVKL